MMVSYMAAVGRRISRFILIYEQNIIADTYFVLLIKLKKSRMQPIGPIRNPNEIHPYVVSSAVLVNLGYFYPGGLIESAY